MEATLRIIGRGGLDGAHIAPSAEAGIPRVRSGTILQCVNSLVDAALRFAPVARGRSSTPALNLQSKAFDTDAWIESLVGWYAQEFGSRAEIHVAGYEAFSVASCNE